MQALTIDSSSAIKVKGLTIQNSQQMHFTISRSDSVRIYGVKVSAPGDSPNTDGIHISESTNVVIQDSKIGTGSQLSHSFVCQLYVPFCRTLETIMMFTFAETCVITLKQRDRIANFE